MSQVTKDEIIFMKGTIVGIFFIFFLIGLAMLPEWKFILVAGFLLGVICGRNSKLYNKTEESKKT